MAQHHRKRIEKNKDSQSSRIKIQRSEIEKKNEKKILKKKHQQNQVKSMNQILKDKIENDKKKQPKKYLNHPNKPPTYLDHEILIN